MSDKNDLLKTWNNGVLRGSQRKLAKALNVTENAVANWLSGRIAPSEMNILKMSKLFNKSEEEIKQIFDVKEKKYAVSLKDLQSATSLPKLGILINNEVILLDLKDMPNKEDFKLKRKKLVEVRDSSLSRDYQQGDKLKVVLTNNIKPGVKPKYYLVKEKNKLFITTKLTANAALQGYIFGYEREELPSD